MPPKQNNLEAYKEPYWETIYINERELITYVRVTMRGLTQSLFQSDT